MTLSVVHVLAPAPYGGLETVVEVLAPAQAAAGLDVTVVGVFDADPADQPFWRSVSASGVRAIPLVLPGRRYGAERERIREILAAIPGGVLHTHGYRPDVVDAPVARAMGVPTVTTVHGFTTGSWRNRFYEWMQRRSYRRFDAVVAVSERLRSQVVASGVADARVHAVRNAWRPSAAALSREEARRVLNLPPDHPVVGWVGRLHPGKGPDVALRAFAAAPRDATLVFIGDGPARGSLETLAESLGVNGRVRFAGRVPGAGRLLRSLDAFLMSSWSEGTPMVILEAMSAGVPIVTTAVGGIPDVVSAAEAVLVPAGDVGGLCRGLSSVLEDPEGAAQRARAAGRRVETEFAVGPWVERYEAIYRGCLQE